MPRRSTARPGGSRGGRRTGRSAVAGQLASRPGIIHGRTVPSGPRRDTRVQRFDERHTDLIDVLGLVDHYLRCAPGDGAFESAKAIADWNEERATPPEFHDRELTSEAGCADA